MIRNHANYLLPLCLWTLDNWLWIEFSWRVSINFNCRKYNAYKMTPLCCYITGGSLQHTLQHHCRPPSASLSPAPSPGHPPPVQELQELQEVQELQGATLTSGPGADTGRGPLVALGGVQQQPCAVSMCTLRARGGPRTNTKCLHRYLRKSFQKCIYGHCMHQSVLCSLTLSWKYRGVCLQFIYNLHFILASWLLARWVDIPSLASLSREYQWTRTQNLTEGITEDSSQQTL